jgi:hypothetical protein
MRKLILSFLILLFVGSALAVGNCYWQTDNPTLNTPATTYKNPFGKVNEFSIYPIWDWSVAKRTLRFYDIKNVYSDEKLNGTVIGILRAEDKTSKNYLADIKILQDNCELKEYKRIYGYNNRNELTDAEKWNNFVKWWNNHYECHTECRTWHFCAFGSCSENRICWPKCTRIA